VPDCEQALRLNPGSTAAHINLGVINIRQKNYAGAVGQFDQTIALAPDSATAFLDRGIAYELLGSRDDAIADYQNALKIEAALPAAQAGLKRLGVDPAAPGAH
jgi:lipoprotein NlpI